MKKGGFAIALFLILSAPAYSQEVQQEVDKFSINERSHLLSCMNCHDGKFTKGLNEVGRGIKNSRELIKEMKEKCLGYGNYAERDAENIFKELKNVAGGNSKTFGNDRRKDTETAR